MIKKPIIIRNSRVPALLSWVIKVYAITLFPFVFIRDQGDDVTITHETIHHQQYLETLIICFPIIYVTEWLVGLIKYRDAEKAYRQIRFEQEAYNNDLDGGYLEKRKPFAWLKYKI